MIRNCWKKANILPLSSCTPVSNLSIPISSLLNVDNIEGLVAHAKKQLNHAFDELGSTWILQAYNRMDIKALLNPADKSQVINKTTDEEMCQAVLDVRKTQEEGLIIDGDNNIDGDASSESCPMHCKVLWAVSVINKYIDILDDPVAYKLHT